MSEPDPIEIADWVDQARNDPVLHLERQATEIILNAIGLAPPLSNTVMLKGGILMGVVHHSPRQTADLDFTTTLEPEIEVIDTIRNALNESLPRASANLGYPDIACKVQSITRRPTAKNFASASFPSLEITVAYAHRNSPQHRHLVSGNCTDVVSLDLSFNEYIYDVEVVRLGPEGARLQVYSLLDLIAEKLRALLQQTIRNRNRRQDVYDIALLSRKYNLNSNEKKHLLEAFRGKCRAREIEPDPQSLKDPELVKRARAEWETLAIELGELPPFDECFAVVEQLYESLPWSSTK
jgi:predicted nucleotidyltransferase component of viral defense system